MSALAQTKRAFIVGVEDYEQITPLDNTLEDAEGYAEVFKDDLGFEVTTLLNPGYFEFNDALAEFANSIEENDEIVFVFSGHGWSDGASNFLVMRDAPFETTTEALRGRTFDLNVRVMDALRAKKPALVFAIIDACRDNPFDLGTRSFSRGMVPQQTVPGSLIVYAAGANESALDRLSPQDAAPYSVFTRSFLPKLKNPNVPLMRSVDQARAETAETASQIGHVQRPAVYSDIAMDFCFAGDCDTESISWSAAKSVNTDVAYYAFLEQHPDGRFWTDAMQALARGNMKTEGLEGALALEQLSCDGRWDFSPIYIDFDRTGPSDTGNLTLQHYADLMLRSLQRCPDLKVTLSGHTHTIGMSYNYSVGYSERLADGVSSQLEALGVPAGNIFTNPYGNARPVTTDPTKDGLNRRVEISIGPN